MPQDDDFRSGPPSRRDPLGSSSGCRDSNDSDDYRPRRRRRKEQFHINSAWWIGLGVTCGMILLGITIRAAFRASWSRQPEQVVQVERGRKAQVNRRPKVVPNPPNAFPNGNDPFLNPGNFPKPGVFPLKGIDPRAALILSGDPFEFVQIAVKEQRLADVDITGFKLGQQYRDIPQEGSILIGFEAGLGVFVNDHSINALRPIYLNRDGEKLGDWIGPLPANPITVKAKTGYVLGGINIRAGVSINGMSLTYMKFDKDRLLPADSYKSEWVGGQGGNIAGTIGGHGHFFAGVCGHLNQKREPVSLGLVTVLNSK